MDTKNLKEAIRVVTVVAEMANKGGVLSLTDAVNVTTAIKVLNEVLLEVESSPFIAQEEEKSE